MKTVAIYKETVDGLSRVGTFTPRKYYSIRAISEQFCERNPNADPDFLYMSHRSRLMGKIVDAPERIPFDVGRYKVRWDNGHDTGELSGEYYTAKQAQRAGEEWKREMVAMESTAHGRREANEAYQWEVIEL